ncbi:calvin cycle protein CP12-1 [Pyrus ussuriensis x Pyrus communis]|uniref:Calvin cycle protein CP12-1 n=1 Tax=Pyrus ussuriensis x Pyrus communis TaxID=2448454 RepID=A0A5N5FPK8_9ROSA|nr:calvin cycle protein CP12-1 [Pyrus ussuriensis x Pyrus communis]
MATSTTVAGVSLSTPRSVLSKATVVPRAFHSLNVPTWRSYSSVGRRMTIVRPVSAAPDKLSEKVAESIKSAEETCSDDPASGECVAAWDEVEELSAAVSHKRDNEKSSDPLETFCKDNPETDECRTYDN